jgi:hypothetical protein
MRSCREQHSACTAAGRSLNAGQQWVAQEKKAREEEEWARKEEQVTYGRAMARHVKQTSSRSIQQYVQTREDLRLKAQFLHDSQRAPSLPYTMRRTAAAMQQDTDPASRDGSTAGM